MIHVSFLSRPGLTQEGIYRVSGKAADIETIMKMFDENQLADLWSIENLSANTIASALKQFFKSLPEPIIPYTTQDRMIYDYKGERKNIILGLRRRFSKHLGRLGEWRMVLET